MAEIEPKTREEKLWNGEDIKPLTREEMYIKHIFDETQTIPDHPITRKEMLMEKAGEGGGGDITIKQLTATENRTYSEEGTAYSPVIVNVPDVPPVLDELTVTENGTYTPPSGTDGYNEVNVSVQPKLETLTAIENDTYTPSSDKDGFSQVVVNVPPTPLDDLSVTENGTYNPTSGHGFDEITVNVPLPNNAYLLKSAKDDVVSFSDGSDNFFRTLKAYIEPVQDLHGYDSPWVGGAGKNKLDFTDTTVTSSRTIASDISLKAGDYIVAFDIKNNSNIEGYYQVRIGTTGIGGVNFGANYSGRLSKTFTLSEDSVINIFVAGASSGYSFEFSKGQIELGSTATTFAPYSNICPISGWDEVNVGVSGKNLIPYVELGILNQTDGSEEDNYENKRTGFIRTLPNTQYTISGLDGSGVSIRIFEYKKNKTYIRNYVSSNITNSVTIQTGAEVGYIRFQGSKNIFTSNAAQCEKGTTATTYEPYNGHTYTIDLDGTRYGGTLDVVSGVLTVDRAEVTPTANSVGVVQDDITYASCLVSGILDNNKCISNEYKHIAQSDTAKVGTFKVYQNNGSVTFVNKGFTNVTTANQILSSTQLVFQIATPITIQLTPTQVKSLLGVNNVWADTGETEVEYFAKEVSA